MWLIPIAISIKLLDEEFNFAIAVGFYWSIANISAEVNVLRRSIYKGHKVKSLTKPKSFKGINSYGLFSGVQNYFVIAGSKKLTPDSTCPIEDLDERAGTEHFEWARMDQV